jgi:uncharacterized protein (DUF433 family)
MLRKQARDNWMPAATHPKIDIYGGRDPIGIPAYAIALAAHCLQLPPATVRSWVLGRSYPTDSGPRQFPPLIRLADPDDHLLSFLNLVELHVLSAIRRDHQVKIRQVRKAITFLSSTLGSDHPLADQQMLTNGKDIFIEKYGELICCNQEGQMNMKSVLGVFLKRIERNKQGLPVRLYPFVSNRLDEQVGFVSIDPRVRFGRPCIAGTGIPTAIVAERHKAGDLIQDLAKDYGRSPREIEEAIRYEERPTAA